MNDKLPDSPTSPQSKNSLYQPEFFTHVRPFYIFIGICVSVPLLIAVVTIGKNAWENAKLVDRSVALVREWVERLDGQTHNTGVYIKHKGKPESTLPVKDAWGNSLTVNYSRGGLMEVLKVRSNGRDGLPFTTDDIVMEKKSLAFAGIGEGVKKNTEETAANASRGMVDGAFQGLKKHIKLPGRFKKDEDGS